MRDVEEILEFTDNLVYANTGEHLNDIQKIILQESWQKTKKTYEQIAAELGYSANYIKQGVGPKLWRLLSEALGEKVSKINIHSVILRQISQQNNLTSRKIPEGLEDKLESLDIQHLPELEFPQDSVPLDSPFYIKRIPHEDRCYEEIVHPGAFIRIKAPRQMGKTSLMNRIIAYAKQNNYRTGLIHFQQAESLILTDLNKCLRWFCANLTRQLKLESKLNDYWDEELGSKMSCNLYMQECILEEIDSPIVLALEEVNEIIEHPQVAKDFLSLIRYWHEKTKTDLAWQNLRLVMVHSTEIYIPLDINQSPLNVGLRVELEPFSSEQVIDLVQRHQLDLDSNQITQFMNLVAGHPYLVRLALYSIAKGEITFEQLMETSFTDSGIYHEHLHRNLRFIQESEDLIASFLKVLESNEAVTLEQVQGFKLQSMGLVKLDGNKVRVSCDLYQKYFHEHLN
jgi:AAA-like domain